MREINIDLTIGEINRQLHVVEPTDEIVKEIVEKFLGTDSEKLELTPLQTIKVDNPSNNEIIFDDAGKPSMMVRIPKFNLSDVIDGAPNIPHPAFVVNGVEVPEIYISKYQNIIVDEKAYSLPFQQPAVDLNYDTAAKVCENKGKGWHLMSNAEWAAIALWCKKYGTLPHGNNSYGKDYEHENEKGIKFDDYKVLTGSGPNTWSHDHTESGIFDLNGNVWEWVSGLKLENGEIRIIQNNDAAVLSQDWKSILVDGKSVKYSESNNGGVKVTTDDAEGYEGCRFADIETDIDVPIIMKALGLFPSDDNDTGDYFYADASESERLPYRGGHWNSTTSAGVFSLNLYNPRASTYSAVGFRSAYVNL